MPRPRRTKLKRTIEEMERSDIPVEEAFNRFLELSLDTPTREIHEAVKNYKNAKDLWVFSLITFPKKTETKEEWWKRLERTRRNPDLVLDEEEIKKRAERVAKSLERFVKEKEELPEKELEKKLAKKLVSLARLHKVLFSDILDHLEKTKRKELANLVRKAKENVREILS